jgi:hypothetical protein
MTYFVGNKGAVKLRRGSSITYGQFDAVLTPADVITSLNRFTIDEASDALLNGDRIELSTTDPRKLVFINQNAWAQRSVQDTLVAFVNVNLIGGIRLYPTFEDAINNNRLKEITLQSFDGDDIELSFSLRDTTFNVLGGVRSYTFTTDYEAIDTSSLSDTFKNQISAGLISGSGTIDCLFTITSQNRQEPSLLMLQLAQRLKQGSEFSLYLYLTDPEPNGNAVFYSLTALIVKAGVSVPADNLVNSSIDFITSGDIKLNYGQPTRYILQENEERIQLEQTLGFLLQEISD